VLIQIVLSAALWMARQLRHKAGGQKKARQGRALKGSQKPGFEKIQGDNWVC